MSALRSTFTKDTGRIHLEIVKRNGGYRGDTKNNCAIPFILNLDRQSATKPESLPLCFFILFLCKLGFCFFLLVILVASLVNNFNVSTIFFWLSSGLG